MRHGATRLRLRTAGAAAAATLLAVACNPPFVAHPLPSPSPEANNSLTVADAAMEAGRYEQAEADYQALIARGDAHAQAHYATLLDYEDRFEEATAQARAAVGRVSDSATLARLTRALDWSNQIPAAVSAGERAVTSTPVDPLAHSFLAEALADSGRYSASEAEMKTAAAAAVTPYQRSEVEREWSNYWRDRGDAAQSLAHIKAAQAIEPGFPERQLELVRFDLGADPPLLDQAHQLLRSLRQSFGGSYAYLVEVGDTAAASSDDATAEDYYRSALKLEPGGAAASLGLAEVEMAVKRDPSAARDLLVTAIHANPGSGPVYEYLRYLDLLVLHQDPAQDLPPAEPSWQAGARAEAYAAVSGYRRSVGMAALAADTSLEQGALAHCYYYLFNYGQKSLDGLGVHAEASSLPGFTGENSLVRDQHFGYRGDRGSEVIDHVFGPAASVEVWFDSVYHRLPMLDADTQAEGYGEAAVGLTSIATIDFGIRPPTHARGVAYPYAGQTGVPGTFTGNEIPDPVPQDAVYPVGYPVTLQFGEADSLQVSRARLLDAGGAEVPSYLLSPGTQDLGPNEWSLLARQALQPGDTYTVDLAGRLNGAPWSRRWSFTVADQ